MASMGGGDEYHNFDAVVRTLKAPGMVNKILQQICSNEHLKTTGVKADLQNRIKERLQSHRNEGVLGLGKYRRLRQMIEHPGSMRALGGAGYSASPAATPPAAPHLGPSGSNYTVAGGGMNGYRGNGHRNIHFKKSPFYKDELQVGETKECLTMTAHRHTVSLSLRASEFPILSRVSTDESLRVMVFCAAEGPGLQDIAFPHQSEIKVNGGEVKANLRGLKNKPGSTRPVDITKDLRLRSNTPTYENKVEMTYALTNKASGGPSQVSRQYPRFPPLTFPSLLPFCAALQKLKYADYEQKFYLSIYVVMTVPVSTLVRQLEIGNRITKESVINDMMNKARDADIVATASVLSLKCPLSTLRIDLPCRSISCRHNQCFDATSYLQLQEQGPTWLCPICNNPAPFNTLTVDNYVKDILNNTSQSTDQVTIQPNGEWELHNKPTPTAKMNGVPSDDDDDLVEITKSGDSLRMGVPRAFGAPVGGQPSISRELSSSVPPRNPGSTSGKRPISAVIDLTSSGDEDDEPIARAPKRQFSSYVQAPAYRPAVPDGYTPRP